MCDTTWIQSVFLDAPNLTIKTTKKHLARFSRRLDQSELCVSCDRRRGDAGNAVVLPLTAVDSGLGAFLAARTRRLVRCHHYSHLTHWRFYYAVATRCRLTFAAKQCRVDGTIFGHRFRSDQCADAPCQSFIATGQIHGGLGRRSSHGLGIYTISECIAI